MYIVLTRLEIFDLIKSESLALRKVLLQGHLFLCSMGLCRPVSGKVIVMPTKGQISLELRKPTSQDTKIPSAL